MPKHIRNFNSAFRVRVKKLGNKVLSRWRHVLRQLELALPDLEESILHAWAFKWRSSSKQGKENAT